jgi:hypothetical protein
MPDDLRTPHAFALVVQYCEQRGWIPVGQRKFTVGDWDITVNGAKEPWEKVPPFHVLISNRVYIGMLVASPLGGSVAGFHGSEDAFIETMRGVLT